MKKKTVINNLKAHLKWVERQNSESATKKAADKAEDIVCGILDILESTYFDAETWLDRGVYGRPAARKPLERIRTTFYRKEGKKALCALILVAIEILEGEKWIDEVYTGILPARVRESNTGGIGQQECRALF